MNIKRPTPKQFDKTKYWRLIKGLSENMSELEFERSLEVVAYDILENYVGFEKLRRDPNFVELLLISLASKMENHI